MTDRMHAHTKADSCWCGVVHNTQLILTEGVSQWLLTCDGNYVRSFDLLDQFREWMARQDYRDGYGLIIVGSVKTIRDW